MALSDATEMSFGHTVDPTIDAKFDMAPHADNENAPKKPQGMDFADGVEMDMGINLLFGGLSPALSMATQTAFSAGDLSEEMGYYAALRQEMAAAQVAAPKPANDFKPSLENTSFSPKSKTDQGFQVAQSSVRPSDTDGRRRVVDMNMSAQALGMQMMNRPTLGGPR